MKRIIIRFKVKFMVILDIILCDSFELVCLDSNGSKFTTNLKSKKNG